MSRDISEWLKPGAPEPVRQKPASPPEMAEPDAIELGEIISLLLGNKWLIISLLLMAGMIGWLVSFNKAPVYHVDASLQVEEQQSGFPGLEDVSALLDSPSSSATTMKLVSSRTNLGRVVDELNLRISVAPRHAPLLGRGLAMRYQGDTPAPPPPWLVALVDHWLPSWLASHIDLSRYDWGGASIHVNHFDVEARENVSGWTIQAGKEGGYLLRDDQGRTILSGEQGKTRRVHDDEYGEVVLFVREIRALPGTQFNLSKSDRLGAIQRLKRDLKVKEIGKKTGIIELSMNIGDRQSGKKIIDAIADTYLRRDVERKSQEAQQMLAFIDKQLPALKANLEAAESALEARKRAHGAVDLGMKAQAIVDSSADIEKQISLLQMEYAELSRKFTDNHPRVAALKQKLSYLKRKRGGLESKLKAIPQAEWESAKLARNVKVANELYLMLLNKGQELKVAKAGTTGNVRIVDRAAAELRPVSVLSIIGGALLIGAVVSAVLIYLRRSLHRGMIDPGEIEAKTGLPVYAEVLESREQRRIKLRRWRSQGESSEKLLARRDPKDMAIEALRSLRTYLQFARVEAKNNIIVISGPSSGVGKSFLAANLSAVLADSERKVLLIDADIRKGYLHAYFNDKREPGLTDLITGKATLKSAIRIDSKHLHYLPTGTIPPNPAEILGSRRFTRLLLSASRYYDAVIVDTPPVLAVTDPLVIAKQAGSLFLVLKAGEHHEKEVTEAVKRFDKAGIQINGFILNQLPRVKHTKYGYGVNGHAYYQYSYQ